MGAPPRIGAISWSLQTRLFPTTGIGKKFFFYFTLNLPQHDRVGFLMPCRSLIKYLCACTWSYGHKPCFRGRNVTRITECYLTHKMALTDCLKPITQSIHQYSSKSIKVIVHTKQRGTMRILCRVEHNRKSIFNNVSEIRWGEGGRREEGMEGTG